MVAHSTLEGGPRPLSPPPAAEGLQVGSVKSAISQETWIAIGILVLTLVAYSQVMGFFFVSFDDQLYITRNPIIQEGVTWKSIHYAFTTGDDGSYLPLVWLSHAACVSIFGSWAGGHHLVNLLLHGTNSVLLFYFLRKITKSIWPSACVAFLFALHPLHVESVAWVSERKDVLSTLFWILTSGAYVRYVERPGVLRYLGMVLLFVLGLLSKSMLVTLPITLLLFDIWPLRRIDWAGVSGIGRIRAFWPLVMEKIPLFALSLGAAAATFRASRGIGAAVTLTGLPLQNRIGNSLMAVTTYLRQMVWPWNLSAFYPYYLASYPMWSVIGSLAFILLVSAICVVSLRRRPYLAVGWFWYLITLLPVVGIVQVGSQAHADRYTYVPLIGIFLMLSWLAEEFVDRWRIPRLIILAISGSLLGIMFTLTVAQSVVWRDNLTLFKNALSLDTDNPVALLNIGDEYMKRDQFQNAYAAYFKALKFAPNMEISHLKLAYSLERLGRDDEALRHYWRAYQLKPGLLFFSQKIGQTLTRMGRFEEAAPFVQKVMLRPDMRWDISDPVDPQISSLDWAAILRSRNCFPEAVQVLETVLAKHPKSLKARVDLGVTLRQMGRLEEALRQMEMALEVSPRDPLALFYLGDMLIQFNRLSEARSLFERLKEVDPHSPLLREGMLRLEKAQAPKGLNGSKGKLQVSPS